MQNKPNLNRKSAIETRKSLTLIHPPNANSSSKNAKNTHLLQSFETHILNSMHNKDLHKYFTPKYGPQATSDEKMKNKANFNPSTFSFSSFISSTYNLKHAEMDHTETSELDNRALRTKEHRLAATKC
jgi:hypothetical protein